MNEIINVNFENETVSARELHKSVGSTERFSNWFDRQLQYGFEEGADYLGCKTYNTLAKQELQDFELSIDAAIQICEKIRYRDTSKILNILHQLRNNKCKSYVNKPRFEICFGEMLDEITGYKWDRQILIDNGKYRVDFMLGYELAVEYDEEHHVGQTEVDLYREKYIQEWLRDKYKERVDPTCEYLIPFIRVKKGEELLGIRRIIEQLVANQILESYDSNCIRHNPEILNFIK